jgi:hypothetical protein
VLDEKMLAEITRTAADARFGYTTVDCTVYYRHVSALLEECSGLREIAEIIGPLHEEVEGLRAERDALPDRLRGG